MAAGANSMVRELGGVVGIAVLASVFSRRGVYSSPQIFIHGFAAALVVGVAFSVLGALAALVMPSRAKVQSKLGPRPVAIAGESA
jgi:hypothetical protein